MTETPRSEEPAVVEMLRKLIRAGGNFLARSEVPLGSLAMWSSSVRNRMEKIYGKESPLLAALPPRGMDRSIADTRAELTKRVEQLRRYVEALETVPEAVKSPLLGRKIFIGHGRSLVWLQLKDFIRERFNLPCDEFNVVPAAGLSTTERLQTMLEQAGFAFVVMTAEDQHADGLVYARPNVIHESGLFQGKLGTRRAIVMLEEGCSDFSNISGLTQIRFPKGDMRASFEEVRGVLEREKFV